MDTFQVQLDDEVALNLHKKCHFFILDCQPDDFKPFVLSSSAGEADGGDSVHRWVGGDDSDSNLSELTSWWLVRKEAGCRVSNVQLLKLLNLTQQEQGETSKHQEDVAPMDQEKEEARRQAEERFSNPDQCYVYRKMGREYLVGPVERCGRLCSIQWNAPNTVSFCFQGERHEEFGQVPPPSPRRPRPGDDPPAHERRCSESTWRSRHLDRGCSSDGGLRVPGRFEEHSLRQGGC